MLTRQPKRAGNYAFVAVTLLSLVLLPSITRAGEAAYVGTWGTDAAQCKISQDMQGAPLQISANAYDQHEAHCMFKSVTADEAKFKIAAECTVEGDPQPQEFSLTVADDKMTWDDRSGALDLIRCK
jgi:hypothetical protein